MGANDEARHPRLADEKRLIQDALRSELPLLGICLGSQLLAATLGARVYSTGSRELGWLSVELDDACASNDALFRGVPRRFTALHWHGDVFELPTGARHLARSARTLHQAFAYGGSAWGLLFHLEAGVDEVRAMATAFPEEVIEAGMTGDALVAEARVHAAEARRVGRAVCEKWVELLHAHRP